MPAPPTEYFEWTGDPEAFGSGAEFSAKADETLGAIGMFVSEYLESRARSSVEPKRDVSVTSSV